jgi:hypothetical protein
MTKRNINLNFSQTLILIFGTTCGVSAYFGGYYFLKRHGANFEGMEGHGWGIFLWCLMAICGVSLVLLVLFYV